ncbi:MAG: glycosyltransferase family 4 protein [Thermoleophilia bacterium]
MRIGIVTVAGHGIGGMQDHTRDLALGLVAAGHDVHVIAARHPERSGSVVEGGVDWHHVDAPGRYERFPFHHPGWLRGSFESFAALHDERPFDVLHSESSSALELLRRGVHRRVPIVVMYHGNVLGLMRAAVNRATAGPRAAVREGKLLVWTAAGHLQRGEWHRFRGLEWIVPSRQQFEETRRSEWLDPRQGHVVPNGIDPAVFRPIDRRDALAAVGLPDRPTLVSVGRLNHEKGMDVAILALSRLRESPEAQLVLVGSGEFEAGLRDLARREGVAERVVFAGPQPHHAVVAYMNAADVYLFPTLREEAAPVVLPQAMGCGAAVVASRIGGIPEVIGGTGERGLLVRPGDVDELATTVDALLRDPVRRASIGTAARRHILQGYTVERMTELTVEVYRRAIARGRPPTAAGSA